ncbi:LysR family transcriptional regulator ArgP [Zooshikella ganghwensis]|uniref:LysR family transcriptional regulator ArgP n=1 Tax=Zooshikella ganghwensis TaxID=202772 RepID=UPI000411AF52|nr:LysR family transcriptional regulator ArgP [Zooshikella ganghwensis]
MKLDYKLIEALAWVAKLASFEKAAQKLFITQSAVSQRIKQLEERIGEPLLIRATPPQLTARGQRLICHLQQVQLLEQELLTELDIFEGENPFLPINISINADSLATWFLPCIESLLASHRILLSIQVEDELRALQLLKRGDVAGCISCQPTPLPGCKTHYLGDIHYYCVASPQFIARYFKDGFTLANTQKAPAIIFNQFDTLHEDFLIQFFGEPQVNYPTHLIPSSDAFLAVVENSIAYALIPHMQVSSAIETGRLINLTPQHYETRSLYWHTWHTPSQAIKLLTKSLKKQAHLFLINKK